MSRAVWIKHAFVFLAAIFMVWLGGVVPVLVLKPGAYAGLSTEQILTQMGGVDVWGLLRGWPIYIALAIVQALTFRYVKAFATPVYLSGVFILAALLAWRFWTQYGG